MHRASTDRIALCWGLMILAITVFVWACPARAAEEGDSKPAAAAVKEGQAKRPAARLPNYYREVVTEEQREKILAIQEQYSAQIDPLRRELEKLARERDQKIESLLTPEQKKQIEDLRAAAKAKRDADRRPKSGKSARPSRAPAAGKKTAEPATAK